MLTCASLVFPNRSLRCPARPDVEVSPPRSGEPDTDYNLRRLSSRGIVLPNTLANAPILNTADWTRVRRWSRMLAVILCLDATPARAQANNTQAPPSKEADVVINWPSLS